MRALCLLLLCAGTTCAAPVKTGLDVLRDSGFAALKGKRVGVLTNHTGRDAAGRSTVELLAEAPGVGLVAIFSPEHGFTGVSEANAVSSGAVRLAGREIPVYSLYRGGGLAGMRPTPEQLRGLDVFVFDIQDIGARFYTYLATMALALEECAKAGVEFVVLDRPNPINGVSVEGPPLDDEFLRTADVSYSPVTVRHGMTAGEIALLHNARVRHPKLTIVKLEGWKRSMWYDDTGLAWTPTSPNMPDLAAATLYPGVACVEDGNVSVGRGTPTPFGWIGAPWLKADALVARLRAAGLRGVEFRAETRTPTKAVYPNRECGGVAIRVTDRAALEPLRLFAHLVTALRDTQGQAFDLKWERSRRLIGSAEFKRLYDAGASGERIARFFAERARPFAESRKPFLLY